MLKLTGENSKKQYLFIPTDDWSDNIETHNLIMRNDIFEKYNADLKTSGELIICNKPENDFVRRQKLYKESYQEYLNFIMKRDIKNERWIYNIIDKNAEQDAILYRDDKIIIIPTYKWNGVDMQKLHILTIPTDKSIRSIRDLAACHIELLLYCKTQTLNVIKEKYGYDENLIKIYLHYPPSTYHLHIHFVLISNIDATSSCEYSHELSNVIFNLKMNSEYYKLIDMNKLE